MNYDRYEDIDLGNGRAERRFYNKDGELVGIEHTYTSFRSFTGETKFMPYANKGIQWDAVDECPDEIE